VKTGTLAAALTTAVGVLAGACHVAAQDASVQDFASELSVANQALYTTNHLKSITEPAILIYDFERKGTLGEALKDSVEEKITEVLPSGRKNMSFQFLSGENRVRFPPQYGFNGNPIFMLFLEHDVRELQQLTGGNALYFRNRIRNALAGSAEVNPTTFTFRGETFNGTEIRIQPFLGVELAHRFPKYAQRTYVFILSDEIPGGFYRVSSITPAKPGEVALNEESLTFREIAPVSGQGKE
jgi:hypothetical protein